MIRRQFLKNLVPWLIKKGFYLAFFIAIIFLPRISFAFCFEEAGQIYGISPDLLRAISKVESSGNPRAINRNKNGSYDFGVMQINSFWASTLGLEWWVRLGDPCANVKTGAWILAQCFSRYGYSWEGVGCYNATDPQKRVRYARRVADILGKNGD